MTFYLLVSFSTESLKHIDFDPPSYLPLELSHPAQLIEAVQRSRFKQKSPKKKKEIAFNNYIKKTNLNELVGNNYYSKKVSIKIIILIINIIRN